ncbi:MAG: uroporphyrinogen decarboxylase family protein [Lachnospiraceae bacterium]
MTRKERVIAALEHRETDIIPYFAEFTEEEYNIIAAYLDDAQFDKNWGLHLHYNQYWGWPTEIPSRPGFYQDAYGVTWNRTGVDKDIGVVETVLIPDVDADIDYEFPQLDEARLRAEYEELLATREDKFCMAGIGFMMFERSWVLMGMEHVLMRMLTDPESLEEFYDKACDFYLGILDIALEYDFDGVYFGDDWGQQHGLIMGPDHWRRFIKPRMKRLYARVHQAGKYVFQHSCGDCNEILGDLIEIGLNCYQTFQPEIYDIQEIKKTYGDSLTFWGSISTQRLLPYASPQEVKDTTISIMKTMRPSGGYIAAPTHAVPLDVPPENILAMMEVFSHQDIYL